MLKTVFFALFSHLSVGILLTLLFVPFQQTGKGFFRFNTLLALTLLAAALWAYPHEGFGFSRIFQDHAEHFFTSTAGWSLLLLVVCALLIIVYNFAPVAYRSWLLLSLAAVGGAAVIGDAFVYTFSGAPVGWERWLRPASAILSSVTLGSVLLSMTLGHWYLVVPQLSIGALRRITLIFFSALGLRALFLILTLMAYHNFGGVQGAQTTANFFDLSRWGTLFFARAGFGLVGPLALVYFIWDTVKIRSTQSATGILYIAVFLVLIGETFSKFLFLFTSIPV